MEFNSTIAMQRWSLTPLLQCRRGVNSTILKWSYESCHHNWIWTTFEPTGQNMVEQLLQLVFPSSSVWWVIGKYFFPVPRFTIWQKWDRNPDILGRVTSAYHVVEGESKESATCTLFTDLVEDCGKIWENCHSDGDIRFFLIRRGTSVFSIQTGTSGFF